MIWVLLAIGVVGTIAPPWRGQRWLVPVLALAVAHPHDVTVRPLLAPVAFLLVAVPFAALLNRLGFFEAVAARLPGGALVLWVLGALVTTLLNLDTAVVLLTPLYARIDRRLAIQPALLALVASSALPVSNLTNLIAASGAGVSTWQFLGHLGPPSLVATTVGWFAYRRLAPPSPARSTTDAVVDRPALDGWVVAVVGVVVVGFVLGREVGIEPWMVALVAVAVLAVRARWVPWRAVPLGTGVAVLALGALAADAVRDLDLHRLATADGPGGVVVVATLTALAANLVNNLPAVLVIVQGVGQPAPGLWPALLGVNMGPFVLVTGALSSLLWLEATGGSPREFTRAAVPVVGPAFVAAVATMAALSLFW
ncbi:MAG: Citrate transporter [Acidimicrobiales bacterium]|nr:Citrate transporter [Acidimicrobiales bacterium]